MTHSYYWCSALGVKFCMAPTLLASLVQPSFRWGQLRWRRKAVPWQIDWWGGIRNLIAGVRLDSFCHHCPAPWESSVVCRCVIRVHTLISPSWIIIIFCMTSKSILSPLNLTWSQTYKAEVWAEDCLNTIVLLNISHSCFTTYDYFKKVPVPFE